MCDLPCARCPAGAAGSAVPVVGADQSRGDRVFVRCVLGFEWRLRGSDVLLEGEMLDDAPGAGGVSVALFRAGRSGLAGPAGELVGAAGELVGAAGELVGVAGELVGRFGVG